MRRFVLVFAFAGCGFSSRAAGDDAPADAAVDAAADGNTGGEVVMTSHYVRTIDLTDARVAGTHANFPLLFDVTADWLRSTANGGRVGRTDGRDIRFTTDVAGMQVLVHQVEAYDPVQGRLIAWIKVPTLAPSTVLHVHYGEAMPTNTGDPRTVWTVAGFAAVWHLQPSTTDASGQNPTFNASGTQVVDAMIASGRSFDGQGGNIAVGSAGVIDDVFAGGGTVEAWIRPTSYGENGAGRVVEKGSWLVTFTGTSLRFFFDWTGNDGDWQTPVAVSLNQWHHVAVVYDLGSDATIYLDGAASTTRTQNPTGNANGDGSATLLLGNNAADNRTFDGTLDEVRVSTGARDAGWIATSYENQRDPMGFYTLGAEQPQ